MWTVHNDNIVEWSSISRSPFHAILCDPPYNLDTIIKRFGKENSAEAKHGRDGAFARLSKGFMGESWDTDIAFDKDTWINISNVLYPGALCLAYSHGRTYHRMATAIESAGYIIYPMMGWIYGQGFPHPTKSPFEDYYYNRNALKGALEPICVFQTERKENHITNYGTGMFNIRGARIQGEPVPINKLESWSGFGQIERPKYTPTINTKGRWPANIVIDENFDMPFDRFFYQIKPNKQEKNAGLLEKNSHATIKSIDLNRWLATLLLPPKEFAPRRILVPFSGSGSEMIGAMLAGWEEVVGVEIEKETCEIAVKRLEYWEKNE